MLIHITWRDTVSCHTSLVSTMAYSDKYKLPGFEEINKKGPISDKGNLLPEVDPYLNNLKMKMTVLKKRKTTNAKLNNFSKETNLDGNDSAKAIEKISPPPFIKPKPKFKILNNKNNKEISDNKKEEKSDYIPVSEKPITLNKQEEEKHVEEPITETSPVFNGKRPDQWECRVCTYYNENRMANCEICTTNR